jgi:glycosyltransferase involved in cell wall biosynthesis
MDLVPTVSVIIPVFQDPEGIRACLRSLERQSLSCEQFEVIVVDNGSKPPIDMPDSSLRHLYIVQCTTPGAYAARNAGVIAARGTTLAFTDADCVADERWLENGVRALEATARDAIVGGEVQFLEPSPSTAVALYQMSAGFQQAENILQKGFSATANIFCSRRVFDRIGPFADTLLSGGDREWAWRADRTGVVTIYAPDAIVVTAPRTTLRAALRQARRVAAGRHHLKHSGLAADRLESLRSHRGTFSTLLWIFSRRELGWIDRLRVLTVASLIKLVSILETVRIRLGGQAERR